MNSKIYTALKKNYLGIPKNKQFKKNPVCSLLYTVKFGNNF